MEIPLVAHFEAGSESAVAVLALQIDRIRDLGQLDVDTDRSFFLAR